MSDVNIPPLLRDLCADAEKDGARVLLAKLTNNYTRMAPYRATIVVEHEGKKVMNFGSGFLNNAGKFEWAIRRVDELTDEQLVKLLGES